MGITIKEADDLEGRISTKLAHITNGVLYRTTVRDHSGLLFNGFIYLNRHITRDPMFINMYCEAELFNLGYKREDWQPGNVGRTAIDEFERVYGVKCNYALYGVIEDRNKLNQVRIADSSDRLISSSIRVPIIELEQVIKQKLKLTL